MNAATAEMRQNLWWYYWIAFSAWGGKEDGFIAEAAAAESLMELLRYDHEREIDVCQTYRMEAALLADGILAVSRKYGVIIGSYKWAGRLREQVFMEGFAAHIPMLWL